MTNRSLSTGLYNKDTSLCRMSPPGGNQIGLFHEVGYLAVHFSKGPAEIFNVGHLNPQKNQHGVRRQRST